MATSFSRVGLALAVLFLAPFVSLEEIGSFDLFVVGTTFFQLLITLGMDSGLATVVRHKNSRLRERFLYVSVIIATSGVILTAISLELFLIFFDGFESRNSLIRMTFGYGVSWAILILLFSWLRWQMQAKQASIILTLTNFLSFFLAIFGFYIFETVESFISGLLIGSVFGCMLSFFYLIYKYNININGVHSLLKIRIFLPLAKRLISNSLPYVFASLSLIGRRLVDRAYILALGDPKLIGAYAIVVRWAEIAVFCMSIPAIGFSPILVSKYREDSVRSFGRLMYLTYVILSLLLTVMAVFLLSTYWVQLTEFVSPDFLSIVVPLVAGALFLGEVSIAAYGYLLAQKPSLFTTISFFFFVAYGTFIVSLGALNLEITAIGISFLFSSFFFSVISVYFSEKLTPFGYPQHTIFSIKVITLCVSIGFLFLSPRLTG